MPYKSIAAARKAGFPTTAEEVPLTLSQINKLAEIYDAVKKAGTAKVPFSVAWSAWKKLYKKVGKKWVKREPKVETKESEDILEKKIVKRNGQFCIIHCTPPNVGKIIKCFPGTKSGYQQALRMHRAIMANKYKELDDGSIVELLSQASDFDDDAVLSVLKEVAVRKEDHKFNFIIKPKSFPPMMYERWKRIKKRLNGREISLLLLKLVDYERLKNKVVSLKIKSISHRIKELDDEKLLGLYKRLNE